MYTFILVINDARLGGYNLAVGVSDADRIDRCPPKIVNFGVLKFHNDFSPNHRRRVEVLGAKKFNFLPSLPLPFHAMPCRVGISQFSQDDQSCLR